MNPIAYLCVCCDLRMLLHISARIPHSTFRLDFNSSLQVHRNTYTAQKHHCGAHFTRSPNLAFHLGALSSKVVTPRTKRRSSVEASLQMQKPRVQHKESTESAPGLPCLSLILACSNNLCRSDQAATKVCLRPTSVPWKRKSDKARSASLEAGAGQS